MKYPYLFQAGHIGNLKIKNRIVMAPMGTPALTGYKATFSDRVIDYYERRALGDTGLIITGLNFVSSKIEPWEIDGESPNVTFDARWKVRNFVQLTERVHDHGAKIFAQLTAGFGRVFSRTLASRLEEAGVQAVAPSATPLFWQPNVVAREMTTAEVDTLVEAFGNAASIAKLSQFDGIELHGHEGYLMDQFTTALWNRRTDKYGGDFMGRMHFVLSLIKVIQEKAGPDFPIIYRYGIEHKIEGGRTAEEGIEMAKVLEEAGVAALHVDAGCYDSWHWPHPPIYQPPGCMVDMAEKVRPHVSIPVITVGRLGYPDLANRIIEQGKADFIALGRPLLADPDFAMKARRGQEDDIRPCIGCHECFVRLHRHQAISCAVNPQCADEKRLDISPASEPRTVMVVGGGIAGMEAARVCSLRGHNVTLFEKTDCLGGMINVASKADFKQDIRRLLDYYINQLGKLKNLAIKMKTEVTQEVIAAEKPDIIFIATGSVPLRELKVEGLENIPCASADEVYEGNLPRGSRAFVVGGGSVGCETALYLSKQNWSVVVAETLPEAASDLFEANRTMLLELLERHGVKVLTKTKITKITPKNVFVTTPKEEQTFTADLIVLAIGRQSVNNLVKIAGALVEQVYVIGDCVSPRKIKDGIWEAFKLARVV